MIIMINMYFAYKILFDIDRAAVSKKAAGFICAIMMCECINAYFAAFYYGLWVYGAVLYLAWLKTIALVDYYTGYVYLNMLIMSVLPLIILLVYVIIACSKRVILSIIISSFIVWILLKLLQCLGGMGEGDVDVLFINSIFLSCITVIGNNNEIKGAAGYIIEMFITNMMFMSVASFLFAVRNIKKISIKKMSLKTERPFVPSIYMTAVLFFMYYMAYFDFTFTKF